MNAFRTIIDAVMLSVRSGKLIYSVAAFQWLSAPKRIEIHRQNRWLYFFTKSGYILRIQFILPCIIRIIAWIGSCKCQFIRCIFIKQKINKTYASRLIFPLCFGKYGHPQLGYCHRNKCNRLFPVISVLCDKCFIRKARRKGKFAFFLHILPGHIIQIMH